MVTSIGSVENQVAHVAERLASEFADRVPGVVVREMVDTAYRLLRTARVTQFVPVLVDRSVRDQLRNGSG